MQVNKIALTLDSGILGLQKYGGISNYWNKLIESMVCNDELKTHVLLPSKIVNADFDRSLFTEKNSSLEDIPQKINRYLRADVNEDCDVFHSSYYRQPMTKSSVYIVSVYDFIYENYIKGIRKFVHQNQKARAIKNADEVICISDSTRRDTLRLYPSLDPSSVHVVHLAVDHEKFFQEQEKDVKFKTAILYVGQRVGYKRFDLAVGAVSNFPQYKLSIVGPELNKDEIKLLNSLIPNGWEYVGEVSLEKLRLIYSSAFALIYPSDYEGFGLPILEAMACGCPVLTANNSSLPEIGGDAALYSMRQCSKEYAKKLFLIESERDSLVQKGLKRAKDFTWEKTFRNTRSIYLKGLNKKRQNNA